MAHGGSSSSPPSRRRFTAAVFAVAVALALAPQLRPAAGRPDKETREKFYGRLVTNGTHNASAEDSIADMFGRVLEKEFSDSDTNETPDKNSFNNSISDHQAVLETVAVITHDRKNDSQLANSSRPFQIGDMFGGQNENSDETETVIDKEDNVFVMSNRKTKYPTLQLDLRLIKDLVVIIVSATGGGIIFSCLGQPVIVGYLLAGSLIGPGGLNLISEMVQVETFAQFGVVFLLFALGLEFSLPKLKAVGPVAVVGGLLQIALFMFLCGLTAVLCGAKTSEGVFVGTFLSMSSTAVVSKFLVEKGSTNALHGQVTIGTLILQDCAVGLLFALIPVLGGSSSLFGGMMSIGKLLLVLSIFVTVAYMMTWSFVPRFLKLMIQLSSQTNELYQLAAVAFCLLLAWCSDYLGLSLELGSFLAGVMISTTDFAHHTLEQVEAIRNLFAALFLASIGMLIHFKFLWNHVDILLAAVILVIIVKSLVITVVIKAFGYNIRTAFVVGLSLAQIGEFAFVLLSRASHLHLIGGKMYLLLLGTTALSLVTTPLIFKLIPVVMQLGILMRWFPSESNVHNELPLQEKVTMLEVHNRTL
ncbi:K(+) efflux antiporter 5 isoform X3 [Brachypodium distachyon]|uniref:K(+) efflux antiporter 5 isoform X3 n=1 Tax=Brachypodium distachyon TaxID=15368 RepID=UPI0001C76E6E|nr:K(+) efflux antiporter 5 isoform X3 [Brachypodium distachyon]|eukprot:XP_010229274.1 K(+) efflux antiporter 5 isoform X3 [Brachypodium distachyon]